MRKTLLSFLLLLVCVAASAQKWQSGYYYDKEGKKVTGFLSGYMRNTNITNPENDYFFFSKADDTSFNETKGVKVFAKNMRSFVVGLDTFTVSYSTALKKPFLNVLVNSKIKIYSTEVLRHNPLAAGSWFFLLAMTDKLKYLDITYYYGPDANNLTELDNENFVEGMSVVLAERPDVIKLIQDKTFTYDHIDKLLTFLKTGQVSVDEDDNNDQQ